MLCQMLPIRRELSGGLDAFRLDVDQNRDLELLVAHVELEPDVDHLADLDTPEFNRRPRRKPAHRAIEVQQEAAFLVIFPLSGGLTISIQMEDLSILRFAPR